MRGPLGLLTAALVVVVASSSALAAAEGRASTAFRAGDASSLRGKQQKHMHTMKLQLQLSSGALAKAQGSLGEVITVLQRMLVEFSAQATDDRDSWNQYSSWSQDSETDKNGFIQEKQGLVMSETATKSSNQDQVLRLGQELQQLVTDIADAKKSLKELHEMRAEEHQQFTASLTDITKTIRAVEQATQILQGHYAANGAALEQIRTRVQLALSLGTFASSSLRTPENIRQLTMMLQGGGSGKNPDYLSTDGASQYGSYSSHGGGVVNLLGDLKTQLQSQQQQLVTTESDNERQFVETKAAQKVALTNAEDTEKEKKERKQGSEATIQLCSATIDQANRDVTEAQGFLQLLLVDREKFQAQYNARSTTRQNEQSATQAALDALQAVSAGAKQTVEGGGASSFLQVGMSTGEARKRVAHTLDKLVKLGKELHSPALVQMVQTLQSKKASKSSSRTAQPNQDRFNPVVKLLSDLIARLESEANAETSQHEWCETEKSSSETAKETRETSLERLKGVVESITTNVATLKTEVEFEVSEIARVEEETAMAKTLRRQENELFTSAKKDHEEVIQAIKTALEALGGQEFSLLQEKEAVQHKLHKQEPGGDAPFQEYASGKDGATSASGMLTDLDERYSSALTQLITDEKDQAAAHADVLRRNAQFVADATAVKNSKTTERRAQLGILSNNKAEMKTNLLELHETGKYLMDLRPACDDIRTTYEDRKNRREAEIGALREALQVLNDPSSAGAF